MLGRKPRLLFPRTFNEKIQREMLLVPLRRRKRYIEFADKLRVRRYVSETVGTKYLTRILWEGNDLREARILDLPRKFVIKTNQGSGAVLVVEDRSRLDWDKAHRTTQYWLSHDHSIYFGEWQYRWIEPKVFIEEFLEDPAGRGAADWKFFCFQGRVEIFFVLLDRFGSTACAYFDRNFRPIEVGHGYPRYVGAIERPDCWDEMLDVAERLAKDELFVRVDLYEVGRPVFGELTLAPMAGATVFDPPDWDLRLGMLIP
jgi:hypothetical protein